MNNTPPTATPLNDPESANLVITELATESVSRGADPDWLEAATRGLRVLARKQQYVTSDDLWAWLRPLELTTPEPRAMGAVFRTAAHDRIIKASSDWCITTRPCAHRRPIRIWQSLNYQADA